MRPHFTPNEKGRGIPFRAAEKNLIALATTNLNKLYVHPEPRTHDRFELNSEKKVVLYLRMTNIK
jgi:hypothetical protein